MKLHNTVKDPIEMIQFNVQPNFGMHFQEYKYKYGLCIWYDCGQIVHQCIAMLCLTAPLEISSFGWKTPQIPSGSLAFSQTRVTTTPEPLSLGWPSLRILYQYVLLIQAKEHEFSQFVWNIVFATLPIISRVVLIAMMHIQFIYPFLRRSSAALGITTASPI